MFRGNDIGLDKGKGDLWQIRGTQFRANALKGKRSKTRRGCATATRSQNLQIGNFPSPHQTLPRLLILKSRLPPPLLPWSRRPPWQECCTSMFLLEYHYLTQCCPPVHSGLAVPMGCLVYIPTPAGKPVIQLLFSSHFWPSGSHDSAK